MVPRSKSAFTTVYILGDMAMRGKNSALLALVAQLKGKKILFRGNHDDLSDYRYQRLFEEITDYREIADSFDGKTYNSRHQCRLHDALHGLRAENAERNPIRA